MRISDWSSDVCSSDLGPGLGNVLVEPFDPRLSTFAAHTKIITRDRYGAEDMILQARQDPIARGLLRVRTSVVAARDARGILTFCTGDRVRSAVRPSLRRFQRPLAGLVIRGSGPTLIGEIGRAACRGSACQY